MCVRKLRIAWDVDSGAQAVCLFWYGVDPEPACGFRRVMGFTATVDDLMRAQEDHGSHTHRID